MRGADLNLLLASTLGRSHPWLRRWPSPPGAGLLTPLQVWTPQTFGEVEIAARGGGATFAPDAPGDGPSDPELEAFLARLERLRCRVLRRKRTEPGFGYHYHGLRMRPRGGNWTALGALLRDRTGGGVTCVDAADLERIGCRPHTLTVMARALVRTQSLLTGVGGADPPVGATRDA